MQVKTLLSRFNWWHIALILVLPIILALINPNWIFNPSKYDDFYYLGYQIYLPEFAQMSFHQEQYFIERLMAILPGYYLRQVLSPLMANFVLHLGVYYMLMFSVYTVISRLFHARIALLTVLVMGQFSLVLRATGWDYADGYAMMYFAVCLMFLLYAAFATTSRWRWYLFFAGMSAMALVNSQLFMVVFLPALALFYIVLNHGIARRNILVSAFWGGLGVVLVFVGLSSYFYTLTGRELLSNSFRMSSEVSRSDARIVDVFYQVFVQFPAHWHILFVIASIITIKILLSAKHTTQAQLQHRYIVWACALLFIFSYLGVIIPNFLNPNILRVSFYNIVVFIAMFIVFAMFFAERTPKQGFHSAFAIIYIMICLIFAVFTAIETRPEPSDSLWWSVGVPTVALLSFTLIWRNRWSIVSYVLAFAIFSYMLSATDRYHYLFGLERYANQTLYEVAIEGSSLIMEHYPQLGDENYAFVADLTLSSYLGFPRNFGFILSSIFVGPRINSINFLSNIEPGKDYILTQDTIPLNELAVLLDDSYYIEPFMTQILPNHDLTIHFIRFAPVFIFPPDGFRFDFQNISNRDTPSFVIDGLDGREFADGRNYRWMIENRASLAFSDAPVAHFNPNRTYRLALMAFAYLEEAVIDSLAMTINGQSIPLTRNGLLFEADISGGLLDRSQLDIVFSLDRVSIPIDLGIPDGRTLGVAFDWLTITPLSD